MRFGADGFESFIIGFGVSDAKFISRRGGLIGVIDDGAKSVKKN